MTSQTSLQNCATAKSRHLHAAEWKSVGYRGYTSFLASDNDFLILRRFSTLTVRILLALQDELVELEEQLKTIDDRMADPCAPDVHNGSFREETSEIRLELIKEIDQKLRAYNELVLQHSDLRTRPKVPLRDVQSLSHWHLNHPNAIHPEETKYISQRSDLFSIVPKYKAPLRKLLEKSTHFRQSRLWKKDPKIQDDNVIYTSDNRIESFVGLVNTILGLAMLIAPLWVLAFLNNKVIRLAVITAFLVCFLCLLTFTTVARPFESLGAAAAYAAVLVVFLQVAS